jgi:hypothetical protein
MEQEWLEEKFRQSGHARPAPGEICAVIEYCYNSNNAQMTTAHDHARYREEAELVKAFLCEYYPGIAVSTLAIDFQNRGTTNLRRLGAFEVDARIMIDGDIAEINLWSKLHSKLWPIWPDWQELVKLRLPIFSLVLRPSAMLADGSTVPISNAELVVASASPWGERVLRTAVVSATEGVPVRLLRGVYTLSISETSLCYAEKTVLDLSSISVPSLSGAHELPISMSAKPMLRIELEMPQPIAASAAIPPATDAAGAAAPPADSLGLPHCAARVSDAFIVVREKSTGLELFSVPVPHSVRASDGPLRLVCQPVIIDLTPFRDRIVPPQSSLAGHLRAMFEAGDGGDAAAAGLTSAAAGGWELEVEVVLPNFADVVLDTTLSRAALTVTKGGAPRVKLALSRRAREVLVKVAPAEPRAAGRSSVLPLPPLRLDIRHAASRAHVASVSAVPAASGGEDGSTSPGSLAAAVQLHEGVSYALSIEATATTRAASETLSVTSSTSEARLTVQRASASLSLTCYAAPLPASHWARHLPMLLPIGYEVHHTNSGAKVFAGQIEPPGGANGRPAAGKGYARVEEISVAVAAEGGLVVGESYVLRIVDGGSMQPASLPFTLSAGGVAPAAGDGAGGGPSSTFAATPGNAARLALRRATASLTVNLAHDRSGGAWAEGLPFFAGISIQVRHTATGTAVAEALADASGKVCFAGGDALFVGEEYEAVVAASAAVGGATARFTCAPGDGKLRLPIQRIGAPVSARAVWLQPDSARWSAELPPPAGVALRVVHKASGTRVGEARTDAAGIAALPPAGLFAGETYTLEAAASAACRAAAAEFTVRSGGEQQVTLEIERQTSDVTLALRLRRSAKDTAAESAAAALSVPKGMRYVVRHVGLGAEVASGATDAVGKAVLRRKGTLFVGESYEVEMAAGKGMRPSATRFTVSSHHQEVELTVDRGYGEMTYHFTSALAGTSHWAASLPLPAPVRFEIRRVDADDAVLHEDVAGGAAGGLVSACNGTVGASAGLFVGDRYALHVPETEYYAAATAEFEVEEGTPCRVELPLIRQRSALTIAMVSSKAGSSATPNPHWAAQLPVPPRASFRLLHAGLGCLVASGSADDAGRCVLSAGAKPQRSAAEGLTATQRVAEAIRRAFAAVDVDGSGSLSVTEVAKALKAYGGIAADGEEAMQAIKRHDSDGGRSLDLFEFSDLVEELAAQRDGTEPRLAQRPGAVSGAGGGVASRSGILVGEQYVVKLDDDPRLAPREQPPFEVAARRASAQVVVERAQGQIEVVCRNARAGTQHWSAQLPLPEVIAFNVWHRGLETAVATGRAAEEARDIGGGGAAPGRVLKEADALYVGETYVIEIPKAAEVRPCAVEFTMAALSPGVFQKVPVLVARAAGRVTVHLASADAAMPVPAGVRLQLTHKATGAEVVPPVALAGARTELFGEDALLVNQTYVLSTLPAPGLTHSSTDFTVLEHPVRVDLVLARAKTNASIVFRSAAPPQAADAGWTDRLWLPAGVAYEVEHKESGRVVCASQTLQAGQAPRAALPDGALFTREIYILRALPSAAVLASQCEFVCTGAPAQEVTLQVRRAPGAVRVSFVSHEFGSAHWAAPLKLPANIYFEILHAQSGALVYTGAAGESNAVDLPAEEASLYVGEEYTLRVLNSAMLRGGAVDFAVRPVPVHVELSIERAVGALSLSLRSADGAAIAEGLPFQVWHRGLKTVVAEGRTAVAGPEVPCELWFAHQGALYVGEEYEVALLEGHGYRAAPAIVRIGETPVRVQLLLHREEAGASVRLITVRPTVGRDTLEPLLPLPAGLQLTVSAAAAHRTPEMLLQAAAVDRAAGRAPASLGIIRVATNGVQSEAQVGLTPEVALVAGRRYVVELAPSAQVLRSAAVLKVDAGAARSLTELTVRRAWKPLIVVALTGEDGVTLPKGLRLTARHASTGFVVANAATAVADLGVRCTMQADEAFFVGELYRLSVDGASSGASTQFVVGEPMHDSADVVLCLAFTGASVNVRLTVESLGAEHWAAQLPLPPITLDVLHEYAASRFANAAAQLAGSTTVQLAPSGGTTVDISSFARLFSGQPYLLRVFESAQLQPAELRVLGADGPQAVNLTLRRLWRRVRVTLRSAQELPLPYGLRVQARHKALGVVVASGITGEVEAEAYEAELGAEINSAAARAAEASERLSVAAGRHRLTFHSAGEAQLPGAEACWTVDHGRDAVRDENWRAIRTVAAAMADFPDLHLEVSVSVHAPLKAPVILAARFGFHDLEAQPVMLRLARERATAVMRALVASGVPEKRLLATFSAGTNIPKSRLAS